MKRRIGFFVLLLLTIGTIDGICASYDDFQALIVPHPCYVALDSSSGEVYISNENNEICKTEDFISIKNEWKDSFDFFNETKIPMSIDGIEVRNKNIYAISVSKKIIFKLSERLKTIENIKCEECAHPMGITTDRFGKIYISDPSNGRIVTLNDKKKLTVFFDSNNYPNTKGLLPAKLKFDNEGFLYALDLVSSKVIKINASQKIVSIWGGKGSGEGQFINPHGIAFDELGDIFISDTDNNRIVEFSKEGEFLKDFDEFGPEGSKLKSPLGIAIDKNNFLYISDFDNNRVLKIKLDAEKK